MPKKTLDPGLQKRVAEDGSVSWRARIRMKGYPLQTGTFEKRKKALEWLDETRTAMRSGKYLPTLEAKRHTVADLVDRYARDILPTKKDRGSQGPQLAWWRGELGTLTLNELTPARIGEARDKLSARTIEPRSKKRPEVEAPKKGKAKAKAKSPAPATGPDDSRRISPATVNRYLAVLSHALGVAVKEWGWLDDNPMRKVRKKSEPRGRVRFLDDDERTRLLEACKAGPAWLEPIVMLAIATGMRQGEILGLRWADVDLSRKRLVLHETKNGERRAVHLGGEALDVLKRWSKVRTLGEDRVFPDTAGFHHRWWDALARAELKDLKFHDLRHTAASYLAMNGATLSEIAAVLGHKTLAMVKRYAHLSESHVAGVVERMNAKVFGGSR